MGVTEIQDQIIDRIRAIRATHHACTAGEVARQLGVSKSWVVQQCDLLRERGVVAWTTFPGSLHLIEDSELHEDGGARLVEGTRPEVDQGLPAQGGEQAVVDGAVPGGAIKHEEQIVVRVVDAKPAFVELDADTLAAMSKAERSLYYGRKGAATREANKAARLSHG